MAEHYQWYNASLFDSKQRKKTVDDSMQSLMDMRDAGIDFYALAVTGVSGMLGAVVADKIGLELIVVRPKNSTAHDPRRATGVFRKGGYVFYDDLLDSGSTLRHVVNSINNEAALAKRDPFSDGQDFETPHLVAVLCFQQSLRYTRVGSVSLVSPKLASIPYYSTAHRNNRQNKNPFISKPFVYSPKDMMKGLR